MASTVPAKSQPLHNFTLPHLKWNKDGHSGGHHHHRRRSVKSPSRRPNPSSASPLRQSPLRDSVTATPPRYQSPLRDSAAAATTPPHECAGKQSVTARESSKPDASRHLASRDLFFESEDLVRSKVGVYSTNSERTTQKFEMKSKTKDVDGTGIKRSKILIKIPYKTSRAEEENPPEEPLKMDEDGETDEAQDEGKIISHNNNIIDEEIKTWNLRPRKPIRKSLNMNGGAVKNNLSSAPEKNKSQNLHKRSSENERKCEKKEKRNLSISVALSKEEIEEDIFALTGSKPARRPKKRAKNIQRQVDSVFPGLWLVAINPESYRVSEIPLKG